MKTFVYVLGPTKASVVVAVAVERLRQESCGRTRTKECSCGEMLLKLLFLLTYFILVFISVRLFELYVTSFTGAAGLKFLYNRLPAFLQTLAVTKPKATPYHATDHVKVQNKDAEPESTNVNFVENKDIEFLTYDSFIENVEDTKASVWVVQVYASKPSKHTLSDRKWKKLSWRLNQYGIKTGKYKCANDQRLCLIHSIVSSTFILSMPKGSKPKGNVAHHIYNEDDFFRNKQDIFSWVQSRLYQKVKTVHSLSELTEKPVSRYKQASSAPSLSFIYHSDKNSPPLLWTTLSVKFTGRIKFYMLKTNEKPKHGHVFAMNKFYTYSYGTHKGENFSYSCMELFLKTLHPELNDIFIVSVVLLNMACWLELFLQKGGPLRRLLYYVWGFTMANIVLVSVWLPLIQLLYMPQVQPIIEVFLKNLQQMMFTNIAAIVRQDFLQLSQHLHFVLTGFVCYGIFIGYLHYKLRNEEHSSNSLVSLLDNDIQEINDMFRSWLTYMTPSMQIYRFEEHIERILHRLSTPDLWLHSFQTIDYIRYLPTWKHCNKYLDWTDLSGVSSDSDIYSDIENVAITYEGNERCLKCHCKTPDITPTHMLKINDCVICLDVYMCKDTITGLPCGHSFHKYCIEEWLLSGNSQRRCPVCRWPADIVKGEFEFIDVME